MQMSPTQTSTKQTAIGIRCFSRCSDRLTLSVRSSIDRPSYVIRSLRIIFPCHRLTKPNLPGILPPPTDESETDAVKQNCCSCCCCCSVAASGDILFVLRPSVCRLLSLHSLPSWHFDIASGSLQRLIIC